MGCRGERPGTPSIRSPKRTLYPLFDISEEV